MRKFIYKSKVTKKV